MFGNNGTIIYSLQIHNCSPVALYTCMSSSIMGKRQVVEDMTIVLIQYLHFCQSLSFFDSTHAMCTCVVNKRIYSKAIKRWEKQVHKV